MSIFKNVAINTSLSRMIYNNPIDYKIEITLQMRDELLKYDHIEAVKESTRNATIITRIKNRLEIV